MSCVPPPDDVTATGFRTFTRAQWATLGRVGPGWGPDAGVPPVRAGGPAPVPVDELEEVYRPLGQLVAVAATREDPTGQRTAGHSTEAGRLPSSLA